MLQTLYKKCRITLISTLLLTFVYVLTSSILYFCNQFIAGFTCDKSIWWFILPSWKIMLVYLTASIVPHIVQYIYQKYSTVFKKVNLFFTKSCITRYIIKIIIRIIISIYFIFWVMLIIYLIFFVDLCSF